MCKHETNSWLLVLVLFVLYILLYILQYYIYIYIYIHIYIHILTENLQSPGTINFSVPGNQPAKTEMIQL